MENFRIVGGGRFNVKKFLNKNNDMRKKNIVKLFLCFYYSLPHMTGKSTVTGGGRAKGGSSTACFHPFFSYPHPTPPLSIPYITFTQMIFAQDYTHTRESTAKTTVNSLISPPLFFVPQNQKRAKNR